MNADRVAGEEAGPAMVFKSTHVLSSCNLLSAPFLLLLWFFIGEKATEYTLRRPIATETATAAEGEFGVTTKTFLFRLRLNLNIDEK